MVFTIKHHGGHRKFHVDAFPALVVALHVSPTLHPQCSSGEHRTPRPPGLSKHPVHWQWKQWEQWSLVKRHNHVAPDAGTRIVTSEHNIELFTYTVCDHEPDAPGISWLTRSMHLLHCTWQGAFTEESLPSQVCQQQGQWTIPECGRKGKGLLYSCVSAWCAQDPLYLHPDSMSSTCYSNPALASLLW